jgi:hypothetical protein
MYSRQFPDRSRSPPPSGPAQRWNKHLTDWKPLLLLAVGGIYAAGYFARAIIAWRLSLGILPALDFQYFVAGLFLLVPLGAVGLLFIAARELLRWYANWERVEADRRKRTDNWLPSLAMGSCVLFLLLQGLGVQDAKILMPLVLGFFGFIYLWLALLFVRVGKGHDAAARVAGNYLASLTEGRPAQIMAFEPEDDPIRSPRKNLRALLTALSASVREWLAPFFRWLLGWTLLLYGALVALLIAGITMFLGVTLLPHLPQELGGTEPRCLVFDVKTKLISPELVEFLFGDAALPMPPVRRTRKLEAYFSNSEFFIIRLPGSPQTREGTLEFKRSAVVATFTC